MLNDQGFEIVPGVLSPNAVASLGHAIQESSIPRSRAGMRKAMELREVAALATDPTLMQFAKQALGQDAIPFRATLFDKSSDSNWLVVWHQDTALPISKKHEAPGWGRGRLRKVWFAPTHRHPRWNELWPYEYTSTIQKKTMVH